MQKFNTNIAGNISFIKNGKRYGEMAAMCTRVTFLNVQMSNASQTAYTMGKIFEIKKTKQKC